MEQRPRIARVIGPERKQFANVRHPVHAAMGTQGNVEKDKYARRSTSDTLSKSISVITLVDNGRSMFTQFSYPYFVEEDLINMNNTERCQNPSLKNQTTGNKVNFIEYWSPDTCYKLPATEAKFSRLPATPGSNSTSISQTAIKDVYIRCRPVLNYKNLQKYGQQKMIKFLPSRRKIPNTESERKVYRGRSGIELPSATSLENIRTTKSVLKRNNSRKKANMINDSIYKSSLETYEGYNFGHRQFSGRANEFASMRKTDAQKLPSAISAPNQIHLKLNDRSWGESVPQICNYKELMFHLANSKNQNQKSNNQVVPRCLRSSPCNHLHNLESQLTKCSSLTVATFTLHENDKGVFVPFSWLKKIDAEEIKLKIMRKEMSRIPKPIVAGNKFYKSRHSTLVCKIAKHPPMIT